MKTSSSSFPCSCLLDGKEWLNTVRLKNQRFNREVNMEDIAKRNAEAVFQIPWDFSESLRCNPF